MNSNPSSNTPSEASPISNFSKCHEGILSHLQSLGELPALMDPIARAGAIAEQTLNFFRPAVFDHHVEEEKDLFPAVVAAATPGDEREKAQAMVKKLTADHREIEAIWRDLEPQLNKLANGHIVTLDTTSGYSGRS